MTNQFEWLLFLPRECLTECVGELVAAAKTSHYGPTYTAWKSTAEVHADAELKRRLLTATEGEGAGEAVPPPPPCRCPCHTVWHSSASTCVCCEREDG